MEGHGGTLYIHVPGSSHQSNASGENWSAQSHPSPKHTHAHPLPMSVGRSWAGVAPARELWIYSGAKRNVNVHAH
jgi:hypothetical protein